MILQTNLKLSKVVMLRVYSDYDKKRFHSSEFFDTDSKNDLSERLLQTYLVVFNFHVSLLIDFLFMADWQLRDERTELQKRKE